MSRITPEAAQRVAGLARLRLSDEEAVGFARDLDRVLDYVAALEGLDTRGIEPTSHAIPLATPMREDRAVPAIDPELALANAPLRSGTAFVVPKVITGEDAG